MSIILPPIREYARTIIENTTIKDARKFALRAKKRLTSLSLDKEDYCTITNLIFGIDNTKSFKINDNLPKINRIEYYGYAKLLEYYEYLLSDDNDYRRKYDFRFDAENENLVCFRFIYEYMRYDVYYDIKDIVLFISEYEFRIINRPFIVEKLRLRLYDILKQKGLHKKTKKWHFTYCEKGLEDRAYLLEENYIEYFNLISKHYE